MGGEVIVAGGIEVLTAVISIQATVIVGVLIFLIRTREKVTRLEEWVRIHEKRLNGDERQR